MDLSARLDSGTGNSIKRMRHGWVREATGNSERFAKISNHMEVKAIGSSFVFGQAYSCSGIFCASGRVGNCKTETNAVAM